MNKYRNIMLNVLLISTSLAGQASDIFVVPEEIASLILSGASARDVVSFCSASKVMKARCDAREQQIWQALYLRGFKEWGVPQSLENGWKEAYKARVEMNKKLQNSIENLNLFDREVETPMFLIQRCDHKLIEENPIFDVEFDFENFFGLYPKQPQ